MTNAELFKITFGLYSEEFWSFNENQMLEWINTDVPETNVGDTISRQAAIKLAIELDYESRGILKESKCREIENRYNMLPSAQPKQRKARWKGDGLTDYRCSLCGWLNTSRKKTNYCGNCGAMMYNDDHSHPFADDVMMRGEDDG